MYSHQQTNQVTKITSSSVFFSENHAYVTSVFTGFLTTQDKQYARVVGGYLCHFKYIILIIRVVDLTNEILERN